jgi:autotransporter-associated beta strand protein
MPGSLLTARIIRDQSPSATAIFNFNGGTLMPSTNDDGATFMQGLTTANVLGGGAVIDTAGYNIVIAQALLNDGADADGGLTKQGLGTLYLNGSNTYTNTTHVHVGGVGGNGTINGSVTVASSASLLAGASATSIGTLTVNGPVTLTSGSNAKMKISKISGSTSSDKVTGNSTLHYAGTLIVTTNTDMTDVFAVGDTFTMFSGSPLNGSFSGYSLPALPAGMGWDTTQLGANGSISIITAATPTSFSSIVQQGGNVVISGSGGPANGTYYVLTSTNIALPLPSWTPIATNQFDSNGNFSFTNSVSPGLPASFFDMYYVH